MTHPPFELPATLVRPGLLVAWQSRWHMVEAFRFVEAAGSTALVLVHTTCGKLLAFDGSETLTVLWSETAYDTLRVCAWALCQDMPAFACFLARRFERLTGYPLLPFLNTTLYPLGQEAGLKPYPCYV